VTVVTPRRSADILIFAEDPGAANFLTDLPSALAAHGHSVHFATSGAATDYLRRRGHSVDLLPGQCDLEALLAQLAPRLLVIGTAENPDSFGLRLTAIARRLGIPSVGVLDSSTHVGYRFRGRSDNPLEFCTDVAIVPDRVARNALVELGLADSRIVVAGHPHWDHVRGVERSQRPVQRAVPDRTVVLFAAEISSGMDPGQFQRSDEYTLHGSGRSLGRTEIVVEEFLVAAAPFRRRLHLVLRLHPKQSRTDLADYQREFDAVSHAEPSLQAIHAADVVVGMTSMLMIEAALMKRPTLAILPRALEAAWLPTIGASVTPCAFDRDSVRVELGRLLDAPLLPDPVALDRLFPPGALEKVAATCERVGLLLNDDSGTRRHP